MSIKPLLWKNFERKEKDDIWPKKVFGASLIYLNDTKRYFLIGGNFNSYENHINNYQLNRNIITGINNNIENFYKLEEDKISYLTSAVFNMNKESNMIDIFIYDLEPEPKWSKITSTGLVPNARSFQKCIYVSPYLFCFGGVELGSKGENASMDELHVLDTNTFEWKQILAKQHPYNRTEFQWVKISNNSAVLYGGASSPSETFYDDLWMFQYDGMDYNQEVKKEIVHDVWIELFQTGALPGKLKAYSMEYCSDYLYLFGGIDSKMKCSNNLKRFSLTRKIWEDVKTKGKPPGERCYHEMSMLNTNTFFVFGGIKGSMISYEIIYEDLFLFNTNESIWVQPVIGGIQPSPRLGFSIACTNNFNSNMEVMILGGYSKDYDETKSLKIYVIMENDPNSKYYWTIRDSNYKEAQNDDNFLIEAEKTICEYKEKIDNLELETRSKEIAAEEMRVQIEEYKKKFFQTNGFIDDQSQSLEDRLKDLGTQKNKMDENLAMGKAIVDLELKLKFVMQRKTQKTMEFFNQNLSLFIKYYDSLTKMLMNDPGELESYYNKKNLENIKIKYSEKLDVTKSKLEKLNMKEDALTAELHRFKDLEKNFEDLFKNEVDQFKITDES